ncbi:MAG: Gfo/Idh/MocA family oxidoreductase [Planctomycetaceae bacterium]|nr:Gfo/Idh/MocA family oxidoreductase [Planctomycetaceae bacterium]
MPFQAQTVPFQTPRSPSPQLTRRDWLKKSVAAAGLMALPYVVPARALGKDGKAAPSERILLGGIGLGGRGQTVLREMLDQPDVQFLAICDINRSRREAVKKLVDTKYGNADCAMSRDLRGFLAERADIDALLIATGDRWHALASILAMRAGKDVYCEKPSSMTIAEGQLVVETARRHQRVYQTGTQGLSMPNRVFGIELARSGRLGKLHTAYAQIAPWGDAMMRRDWLPAEPEPAPEELDWDAWLGPCPWRPYNSAYVRGEWRNHYDFHTSCIGEWGAHTIMQVQAGIDARNTSAVEYEHVKDPTGDGLVAHYANGVKMILSLKQECWVSFSGQRFDGSDAWIANSGGEHGQSRASSESLLNDTETILNEYTTRTGRPLNHVRDFFDCIKSRRQTVAYPEAMHRAMTTVHAANICMWLQRDLKYDPVKEEFVNDPEANQLRARAMRAPWTAS